MESAPKLFLHIASSMYGGMKRLERSLPGIESRTAESQLTKVVGELREVCSEQAKRLEEVFGSLDQRPSKEPSPATGASSKRKRWPVVGAERDPAVLKVLLKIQERDGYHLLECGACQGLWQVPFYADSIGARR
jgi:hypothetical protein